MNYKKGYCSKCGDYGPIVNRKYNLDQKCNRARLHPDENPYDKKPIAKKRFNEKFPYCTDWGFQSEITMYANIASSRGFVSFFTGKPIMTSPKPANFAHVLEKAIAKYPHFRFNPDNVIIVTIDEHHIIDFGTEEQKKALQNWKAFQLLKVRLIEEYIKRFGDPKHTIQKIQGPPQE